MMKRMVASALFAGCVAGLFAVLLHFAFVEKLILLAEEYETGAQVYFPGAAPAGGHDAHAAMPSEPAAPQATTDGAATTGDMATMTAHDHGKHEVDEDTSPLVRHAKSVLAFIAAYSGFGLMLVAGYAMANQFGHAVTMRDGLLWGVAGFTAVQLAPAMGLEPELPGTLSAGLEVRQIWWIGTAIATAGGLGLLAYGRGQLAWIAGAVLIALPHIIGAPEIEGFHGVVPPELASRFAARSLGVGLAAWVVLGGLLARFWTGKTA
jgi:cobalt transporter subunit CbtA